MRTNPRPASAHLVALLAYIILHTTAANAALGLRAHGRAPLPHVAHFNKRAVSALPRSTSATLQNFIDDLWADLKSTHWFYQHIQQG